MTVEVAIVRLRRLTSGGTSRVPRWALSVLSIGILLVIWQVTTVIFQVPETIVPSVTATAAEIKENFRYLLDQSIPTIKEAIIGFVLAALGGVFVGFLIGFSRTVRFFLYPAVVVLQSLPRVALVPLFLIWFGFGQNPKILLVAIACIFPVIIGALTGIDAVDEELRDLADVYHMRRTRRFLTIELPHSLPYISSALKISVTHAMVAAVFSEMIGASEGLGYVLISAQTQFNVRLIFADIIFITVIGSLIYFATVLLDRLLIPWHISQRRTSSA